MKVEDKTAASVFNMDLLDELIAKENPDEMGLLDLIFVEEILKQKELDRVN